RNDSVQVERLDLKPLNVRGTGPKRVEVNSLHLSVVSFSEQKRGSTAWTRIRRCASDHGTRDHRQPDFPGLRQMKDKVLAFVALLGPNETGEVTFTAPTKPGEYPFLCSFPAHCLIGMKGVLVVK
ncbi:MAG: hypothetical protein EXS43_14005, partial [Opitutus sp.]|nr:hypothetical protein [Opitutus sp.]